MPSLKAWFKVLLATATIVKAAPTPRPPNGVAADTSDLVGATSGSLTGAALSKVPRSEGYSIFKRALRRRANSASCGASLASDSSNTPGFVDWLKPRESVGSNAPGDVKDLLDFKPRRRANSDASSVENFDDTTPPTIQRTGSIISTGATILNNGASPATTSTDNLSVLAGAAANSVPNGRLRTNSNASILSQASLHYQVTPESANGNTGNGGFSFPRRRRRSLASDIAPVAARPINPPASALVKDQGEGNGQPQGGYNGPSGVNSGSFAPPS